MLKKVFILIVLIGLLSLGFAGYFYQKYQDFLAHDVFSQDTLIDIEKGTSFRKFIKNIQQKQANGEEWQWRLLAKMQPQLSQLKAGEYLIESGLSPSAMLEKIINNEVVTYKFTIVEGMNWRELKAKLLADNQLLPVIGDMGDTQLLKALGSEHSTPEGLFMPETYQFKKGDSDLDILKRAHKTLKKELQQVWQNKMPNLPYQSAYELLTMASIVEKESALASERDEISGVFVRRLQKNMRLQTDPTVIYGLGESYDGDIKTKDLRTDTPYNTYTRFGLPPTPIAMPSAEAIFASAHPKKGTALYFVANNRGGHYFSDTYEQHKKAVKDYLKGKKL